MSHSHGASSQTAGSSPCMSIELVNASISKHQTTQHVDQDHSQSRFRETLQGVEVGEVIRPDFNGKKCLFCQLESHDFEDNISHMAKCHGFIVPDKNRLQVDLESFCDYLDLIISGYAECLYCGSQRNNSHAARHHMLAKDHCRIDITHEDSEYREFYDWDTDDEKIMAPAKVDETTMRLPSGKILSDRSVRPKSSHGRRNTEAVDNTFGISDIQEPSNSGDHRITQMRPTEKREHAFVGQLTRLRATDRLSLAHMPISQQRTQLLVQKKQVDQARRSQQFYEGRLKENGNKTLMKHYVPDTPGRTNG